MANRNTLWSDIFVDELARAGLKAVCIAPGSRSTPLTLAFARHGGIKIYTHLDERSAAFFALGLALASDEPVALVCTSGTAAANFFPAIVEAHVSRVPLIVLTADRPPELRHSGANQTIDQVKMYGDYALWSVDAALPEANPPAIAIRNLRTLAARAYAKANGIRKGVVHINMPFRKPLEPVPVDGDVVEVPKGAEARRGAFTQFYKTRPTEAYGDELGLDFYETEKGMIVCGGGVDTDAHEAIRMLSEETGYPIISDVLSGLRFDTTKPDNIFSGYETALIDNLSLKPDLIIRFGNHIISPRLSRYIEQSSPKHYFLISEDGEWSDDSHLVTDVIPIGDADICYQLMPSVMARTSVGTWLEGWQNIEYLSWEAASEQIDMGAYFDGAAVYDVVDLIPAESTLFAGNSLPVRLLDQFGKPQNKRIYVYANRGASGIDGNISTALGAGAARPDQPLVAIVGDITFYHDMNGLLAVQRNGVPVTIVLLNNNGGGIFHRLPIKNFEPEFTDLFVMPHGLEFEHAARMYGLEYVRADDRESFRQAFSESVNNRLSRIIEVRTDAQHDLKRRQEIIDAVQARIKELDL
jgi:2-succinyl-5-enolpyruvyl-6-hydroxy-3-cyclohexene-1-carboxylate synthase